MFTLGQERSANVHLSQTAFGIDTSTAVCSTTAFVRKIVCLITFSPSIHVHDIQSEMGCISHKYMYAEQIFLCTSRRE